MGKHRFSLIHSPGTHGGTLGINAGSFLGIWMRPKSFYKSKPCKAPSVQGVCPPNVAPCNVQISLWKTTQGRNQRLSPSTKWRWIQRWCVSPSNSNKVLGPKGLRGSIPSARFTIDTTQSSRQASIACNAANMQRCANTLFPSSPQLLFIRLNWCICCSRSLGWSKKGEDAKQLTGIELVWSDQRWSDQFDSWQSSSKSHTPK